VFPVRYGLNIYILLRINSVFKWLILYRETISVYCENRTKYVTTPWGLNVDLLNVKSVVYMFFQYVFEC
jgi:hypothetical protein